MGGRWKVGSKRRKREQEHKLRVELLSSSSSLTSHVNTVSIVAFHYVCAHDNGVIECHAHSSKVQRGGEVTTSFASQSGNGTCKQKTLRSYFCWAVVWNKITFNEILYQKHYLHICVA